MNQASQDYSNDYMSYNETQLYSAMSDDERAKAVKKDEAYVRITFKRNLILDELYSTTCNVEILLYKS